MIISSTVQNKHVIKCVRSKFYSKRSISLTCIYTEDYAPGYELYFHYYMELCNSVMVANHRVPRKAMF